jgi:hypothetical protein
MKDSKLYKYIIAGHLMINVPAFIISLGLPILVFNLIENLLLRIILILFSFVVGVAISWLLWSVLITKWRLWAFNRVDEDYWVRLKELAIENRLIWEDGNDFGQTEIRNAKDDSEITEISERISGLEQIEEIKLDLQIPEKVGYKFKRSEIIVESLSKILVLTVALGLLFTNKFVLSLILLVIIIFYGDSYRRIPHIFNNNDYLIVSNKGIQIEFPKSQFISWQDIERIEIHKEDKKMIIVRSSQEKIVCDL